MPRLLPGPPKPAAYTPEEMRAKIVFKLLEKGCDVPTAIVQAQRIIAFIYGKTK
ncbi:hypothetical protein DR61_1319 [Burkholderia pseudomallei]|uniref:Uncharacterized protein n=2 Tax=Burkholderia pseudomallei TaxID=28450 RepID=A0A0E1W761_BURPE|nr:hypothetical protein DR61_1319 [Burkholderia pseudomallei]EET09008.1 hypothetical protein BURPS1710A_1862 [Burkholderia pseudomallei 1710a]KGD20089.1 hypothetical protein DR60_4384 [Burkholderia pseudomallei]CAJ2829587.1 Uncharacterised protein [Burkholderia pseudomallei]CAJ3469588.1 Uncharacterised protein [Burkholderia pseudomallei]